MGDPAQVQDRRSGRRVIAPLNVNLKQLGEAGRGLSELSEDISAGGLFIRTEQTRPVGALLSIEIDTGEPGRPPLSLQARVARVTEASDAQGRGMGLTFVDVDHQSLFRLALLLSALDQATGNLAVGDGA